MRCAPVRPGEQPRPDDPPPPHPASHCIPSHRQTDRRTDTQKKMRNTEKKRRGSRATARSAREGRHGPIGHTQSIGSRHVYTHIYIIVDHSYLFYTYLKGVASPPVARVHVDASLDKQLQDLLTALARRIMKDPALICVFLENQTKRGWGRLQAGSRVSMYM
jgi:hypothetical protein